MGKLNYVKYMDEDGKRLTGEDSLKKDVSQPQEMEMQAKHQEIARLHVMGHSVKKISEITGITPAVINQIKRSPVFQHQVRILQGSLNADAYDVHKAIADLIPKAMENLESLLDGGAVMTPPDRLALSRYILGINGIVPPKDVRVQQISTTLSVDQIHEIRDRAKVLDI